MINSKIKSYEKKKKKSKFILKIVFILITIFLIYCFVEIDYINVLKDKLYYLYSNKEKIISTLETTSKPSVNKSSETKTSIKEKIVIDNSKLNILFLDVGQADCTVIICDGKTMVIDAGNTYDGKNIVNGLKELGIEKIEYLIGTHPHEDHIGGMSYLIDSFEISNIFIPKYNNIDFKFYERLIESANNKNLKIGTVNVGDKFSLGASKFEIMCVDNNMPEEINESSIVVELTFKNLKYLFMADCEEINEKSRTWDDVDLLKVGHHGSNSSSSEDFLKETLPEISVISVGENNDYELPKQNIINRLNKLGSKIYRTDKDGTIQVVSDGKENEVIKIDVSFDGN